MTTPREILAKGMRETLMRDETSVYALAKKAGLPKRSVQSVLSGHAPSIDRAAEICEAFGLEFYIGPPRDRSLPEVRGYDPDLDGADYVMVPKLPIQLAAGHGALAPETEEPVERLAFRREWMRRYGLQPGQVSIVEVMGDSMMPALADGDSVLVDHQRNEPRQGKIFAVRNGDDLLVKRLQKEPAGGWQLTSDNEHYEPIRFGSGGGLIGEVVWRGTWLGEKMASRKEVDDLLRLFRILARHRVEAGEAANLKEAIADIEAEMAEAGVFDDDDDE